MENTGTDNLDLRKLIDQQRLTILYLIAALVVVGGYGVLETKRERAASRTAGAYWEDLYQEREDRKIDLDYIRSLEAKVEACAAQEKRPGRRVSRVSSKSVTFKK